MQLQDDTQYEDELDRMRARRQRRRGQAASGAARQEPDEDFEYISNIEDTDGIQAAGSFGVQAAHSRSTQAGRAAKRRSETGSGAGSHTARPHRKKRKKRGVFKLLAIAAVLLVGVFLYRRFTSQSGYWTVAVFGVDSRDGNLGKGALSDVEILCSINRKTGEIRLASVFRDSYLRIDEDGSYDKINEAYFLGGHEQAVAALEANLGLKVDDYATFNWTAVINAINVLGGVDLEITDKEFAYINSFITETVESTGIGSYQLEHSGPNHLDGVQAVAYARLRLMDTDFNRTERQRKVIGLAMEKAKQADAATLKNLVAAVFPEVSTSIGVDDLLSVARNAKKYYIGQTSGFPFSHTEMKIGKKDCVIPTTLESNVIQLHQFLYDDAQYVPSGTVRSISAAIAEKSGLSEPGNDTESGKNVGAQGNTGGGSQQAAPAQETTAQTPVQETAAEETAAAETESTANAETSEPETGEEAPGSTEPSSEPETILVPENRPDTESETEDAKHPVGPETNSSGSTPNGPSAGPSSAPGETTTNAPNASLEAPGATTQAPAPEDGGPGV